MTLKNNLLVLCFFLLLFCLASAQLMVSLTPKDKGKETMQLYLDELADYELTVYNNRAQALYNLVLEVSSSEGVILFGQGKQSGNIIYRIESIGPGEKRTMFLTAKIVKPSEENLLLTVHYGVETFAHSITTYLNYRKSTLNIDAGLEKPVVCPGEKTAALLFIQNNSEQPVTNFRAELLLAGDLENLSQPLIVPSIRAGQSIEEKRFPFKPGITSGDYPIKLLISFEDSNGKHVIEKRFPFRIRRTEEEAILYVVILIIAILIAIALLGGRKKQDKREAFQKIEKPIAEKAEKEAEKK